MSFKNFMNEEAPVGLAPLNPDTHNRFTTRVQDELGIDDETMDQADETSTLMAYNMYNFAHKWGFLASGPVPVTIEKVDATGNYKVTFHLTQANRRKFYLPYKQGTVPIRYEGPVEDKTELMKASEVEDLKSQGWSSGGGGMPPMPGGMPPGGPMPGGPMGGV